MKAGQLPQKQTATIVAGGGVRCDERQPTSGSLKYSPDSQQKKSTSGTVPSNSLETAERSLRYRPVSEAFPLASATFGSGGVKRK